MPEMEFSPMVNNSINHTYTMEARVRTLDTAVQGGLQVGEEIEVLGVCHTYLPGERGTMSPLELCPSICLFGN